VLVCLGLLLAAGFLGAPHLWAWYHLGAGRSALGQYRATEARAHLRQCLAVWPSSIEANFLAARAGRQLGEFQDAEDHLDTCRRLAGAQASPEIALEWALLRAAAGNLTQVEEHLQSRMEKDPAVAPLILEALAEGYRRMSRVHEALNCVEKWLRLQPDNLRPVFLRGEVHRQVGAVNKAADDYRLVLQRDPEHDEARRPLVLCLVQIGRFQEALTHAEQVLRRHPQDAAVLVATARCRHDLGEKEQGRQILESVLAVQPDHGPALRELGRQEALAGHDTEAERRLREAVRVLPHDYQAVFALAQCLQRQGKAAEAKARAAVAEQLKERIERLSEIRRGEMSLRPFDPALRAEFGKLHLGLGHKETGERWLLSALQLDPRHAAAHAALADYYQEQGDNERAAFHRREAASVSSP
jgi:tetratricopeptide (TPR) repeat protein